MSALPTFYNKIFFINRAVILSWWFIFVFSGFQGQSLVIKKITKTILTLSISLVAKLIVLFKLSSLILLEISITK